MKARKTTFEERVTIVEYYLNHKQSYREVAEHFNISYGQIYQWVHKYQAHGKNGLVGWQRQRKTKSMMTPEEQKEAEIQALKAQNRLLEMENDVLKKFQALEEMIQRETNHGIQNDRSVKTSIPYPTLVSYFKAFLE